VKLSKMEGRSDYGPCHLDSMISGCGSKTMMSLSDGLYIAIEACEGKVIVFPTGPGLGLITPSMEIPIEVTALTREQEEALLNPVLPAKGTTKICVPSDVIEAIKSEINGTVGNIYNVVIKNRSALLHAYMFALARRDGKNCLPFLASLLNADAEAKNAALNCMKMLTNADYAKRPERSTQSFEAWWQLHASEYGISSR
jgi:hypothetical protein